MLFSMALLPISKTLLLVCGLAASAVPPPMFRAGVVRAPDHHRVAVNWLQFDTDACGKLNQFETRDTAAKAVHASDPEDSEEEDDDEWVNAWDMSPSESVQMNNWFSEHPDVAAVTSAIDKSCNDGAPTVLDDAEDSEIT
jgi:hypothetical protein